MKNKLKYRLKVTRCIYPHPKYPDDMDTCISKTLTEIDFTCLQGAMKHGMKLAKAAVKPDHQDDNWFLNYGWNEDLPPGLNYSIPLYDYCFNIFPIRKKNK